MKKFVSAVCGLGLVAGMGLAGPAGAQETQDHTYDLFDLTTDDPRAQALLDELDAASPGWRDAVADPATETPREIEIRDAVNRAINPEDYECGATPLDAYVEQLLADVDPFTVFFLALLGGLDLPTYDALIFGTEGDPDYALPGDAKGLNKAFSKSTKFWDVPTDDIQLIGMHGEMVTDLDRTSRLYEVLYGMTEADADGMAETMAMVVEMDPALEGGDNPIFTLNAFAFTTDGEVDPVLGAIPDKIVMGEGIIDAMDWMGLGSTGAQAILAHEFAHHVQFEAGLFDSDLPENEATRRTELMADAYASFFAAHRKGLNIRKDVILQVQESFYNVGDCSFESPGHHGTPNQRLAAAAWGADLAIDAQKQGHVLTVDELTELFEAQLPILLEPDA